MAVKGVGRSGGGVSGPGRAGSASAGNFAGKVDRAGPAGGAAGAAPAGAAGGISGSAPAARVAGATGPLAIDPVVAHVVELARQLRAGQIKTHMEATRRLVADILRDKVRLQSKQLTDRIVQELNDDPRLSTTLERVWKQAEKEST